jgi:hypothetical protein
VARSVGGMTWNASLEAWSDSLEASSDALERRCASSESSGEPFQAWIRALEGLNCRPDDSSETDQASSGPLEASSRALGASSAVLEVSSAPFQVSSKTSPTGCGAPSLCADNQLPQLLLMGHPRERKARSGRRDQADRSTQADPGLPQLGSTPLQTPL